MEDKTAQSISKSLHRIFLLLLPCAFVCVGLGSMLIVEVLRDHFTPEPEVAGKVVVARADLEVGTELSITNLALKTLPHVEWPENVVSPGHTFAVLGHRLVRPVKKDQPLDWFDTDVPIPTPSVRKEIDKDELKPEQNAHD